MGVRGDVAIGVRLGEDGAVHVVGPRQLASLTLGAGQGARSLVAEGVPRRGRDAACGIGATTGVGAAGAGACVMRACCFCPFGQRTPFWKVILPAASVQR